MENQLKWQSKSNYTALITGASSGIGLEFAHLFAKDGINLVLVARSTEKLENISAELTQKYGVFCKQITCDLAKPGAALELFKKVQLLNIHIDYLVNNAGFGALGFFKDLPLQTQSDMIQVNVQTLTELTYLFVNPMIEKKYGRILNVASTAAFQPGPLMAVYYATKSYVLSFSEALSNELIGTGISITTLCPGPTQPGFQAVSKIDGNSILFNSKLTADSASVALFGYKALFNSKRIVIPGLFNHLGVCSAKIVPRAFALKLVRWLQQKRS